MLDLKEFKKFLISEPQNVYGGDRIVGSTHVDDGSFGGGSTYIDIERDDGSLDCDIPWFPNQHNDGFDASGNDTLF